MFIKVNQSWNLKTWGVLRVIKIWNTFSAWAVENVYSRRWPPGNVVFPAFLKMQSLMSAIDPRTDLSVFLEMAPIYNFSWEIVYLYAQNTYYMRSIYRYMWYCYWPFVYYFIFCSTCTCILNACLCTSHAVSDSLLGEWVIQH